MLELVEKKYAANPFNGNRRHVIQHTPSAFMCRHTCAFLLYFFKDIGGIENLGWNLAGGTMEIREGAGFTDLTNEHWWMERDGVIIDLTADQFGWDPIVVTDSKDARYNKIERRSKNTLVSGLKNTVKNWNGVAVTFADESDANLPIFYASYAKLRLNQKLCNKEIICQKASLAKQ